MKELLEKYGFKFDPKNNQMKKGKDFAQLWKSADFVTVHIKGKARTLASIETLTHYLEKNYGSK